MKLDKGISFANFYANVHFELYKRGLTISNLASQFNKSVESIELILKGKDRSNEAVKVIKQIIEFY